MLRLALLQAYALPLRILRPNVGLSQLAFNPLTNMLFRNVQGPLAAHLPCGTTVDIDPEEYHGRITWLIGSADWKVSRTVNALVSPGDVLLDIGANYGTIGMDAAARVGAQGRVYMFEPQTRVADRLEAAITKGRFGNIELHRIALSNEDGDIELSGPANHTGMATILSSDDLKRRRGHSETVRMCDTARFTMPLVAGHSFGVKIDIEGAEPMVLPGLMGHTGLKFVVFEGANFKDWLWAFFTEHGFAILGLERSLLRSRVCLLNRLEDWGAFHDFVAVRTPAAIPRRSMGLAEFRRLLEDHGW